MAFLPDSAAPAPPRAASGSKQAATEPQTGAAAPSAVGAEFQPLTPAPPSAASGTPRESAPAGRRGGLSIHSCLGHGARKHFGARDQPKDIPCHACLGKVSSWTATASPCIHEVNFTTTRGFLARKISRRFRGSVVECVWQALARHRCRMPDGANGPPIILPALDSGVADARAAPGISATALIRFAHPSGSTTCCLSPLRFGSTTLPRHSKPPRAADPFATHATRHSTIRLRHSILPPCRPRP